VSLGTLPVAFGDPDNKVVRATHDARSLLRGSLLQRFVAVISCLSSASCFPVKKSAPYRELTILPFGVNFPIVLHRFCLFLLLLALVAPLRAQDEPIHMRPEFPLIFPLAQNGNVVTVKFPVLINPTTVIKPGMVLRVMYILTSAQEGSSNLVLAHKGNIEQAYSRSSSSSSDGPKLPPEVAHELEGYRRTIWEVPNNFILAMAQYPTDIMHLIYSPTEKNQTQNLHDERFSFFDGLFVGLPNGKVTVIAVEKESKAEKAGIKAGDEIISVGGTPLQNDLTTFAAAYSAAKKIATDNEVSSYPMTIRSEGDANARPINISMPPKIKSSLMDGF
jgi:membrane-associated protease RseP (regulator of RpoE activity)